MSLISVAQFIHILWEGGVWCTYLCQDTRCAIIPQSIIVYDAHTTDNATCAFYGYADTDSEMAHIGALHWEYHFHECLATHKTFRQYSIETSLVPEIYFLFHKILIGLRLIVPVYFSIESHSVDGGSSLFHRWRYKSLLFSCPSFLEPLSLPLYFIYQAYCSGVILSSLLNSAVIKPKSTWIRFSYQNSPMTVRYNLGQF